MKYLLTICVLNYSWPVMTDSGQTLGMGFFTFLNGD